MTPAAYAVAYGVLALGAVLVLVGVALKRADERVCRVANESHKEDA
jgi:hypothetical protein